MNDDVTLDRRRFLAGMVTALAASELGRIAAAAPARSKPKAVAAVIMAAAAKAHVP